MNTADCHNSYQEQHPWIQQPPEVPIRCATSYHNCQRPEAPKHQKQTRRPRFRAPRLAHPPNFPQQQSQVIGRAFERVRLADIGLAAQPTPPAAAGFADMRKGAFAPFAAPAIQLPPLVPEHAPAAGPEGRFVFGGFVRPAPGLLPPLRNIGSHPTRGQVRQPTIVVIPLVHHHFGNFSLATGQHQIRLGQAQRGWCALRIGSVRKS